MEMCLFVLRDPSKIDRLRRAWEEAGVRIIGTIEGECLIRVVTPHIGARHAFGFHGTRCIEEPELTLWGVAEDAAQVAACLTATERIIGSLEEPGHGVFLSWPVTLAKGLNALNLTAGDSPGKGRA